MDRSGLSIEKSKDGELIAIVKNGKIEATYSNFSDTQTLQIAILGINLTTRVSKGENKNRDLRQSFVILSQKAYMPESGKWAGPLPLFEYKKENRYAIAMWLAENDALEPIQATGGWLNTD
ncbi:MAG: hypothetical protein ACI92G_001398 [Candidatus Pelagisphaera sp.]